jgi:hypothetical protein
MSWAESQAKELEKKRAFYDAVDKATDRVTRTLGIVSGISFLTFIICCFVVMFNAGTTRINAEWVTLGSIIVFGFTFFIYKRRDSAIRERVKKYMIP